MELEIYNAFITAGVSEADAKAAVKSINREIDQRYNLHAGKVATKTDLAELKTELIKAIAESRWTITAIFAAVGLFAALSKILH